MSDSFVLACSFDAAWAVLNDVPRLAPCVPGATLLETRTGPDGDEHHGIVALKLGALSAKFTGHAVLQPDIDRRRIVVVAVGEGAYGGGDVVITATLEPVSDAATQVNLDTDLTMTGRVAQLGKRIIPEVSTVFTTQFAEAVGDLIQSHSSADGSAPVPDAFGEPALSGGIDMPEPEVLDLYDAARRPIMKRVIPLAALATVGAVARRLKRSSGRGDPR